MPLTPRQWFHVASHSKSFTAAGVMKLREEGKLGLNDRVGRYVDGLHPTIAEATIGQLLSHTTGIFRDGTDSGQWQDRRPFLDAAELRRDLPAVPVIESNTRLKYSNQGFGLAGLVIEEVTAIPYRIWIKQAIIEPAGIEETEPDMPAADPVPVARGHSGKPPQTPVLGANGNSIGIGPAAVPLCTGLLRPHRPYLRAVREPAGRQRQRTEPCSRRGGILRHLDRRRDAALGGGSLGLYKRMSILSVNASDRGGVRLGMMQR